MTTSNRAVSTLQALFPPGDLPTTPLAGQTMLDWVFGERQWAKNRPEAAGEAVEYRFNRHGYRAPEFAARAELNFVSVGCSIAFGMGIADKDIFHEIVIQRLAARRGKSYRNWNLAWPGNGNAAIARLVSWAVPQLKPDFVWVHLTYPERRDHYDSTGQRFGYVPGLKRKGLLERHLHRLFERLGNPVDDAVSFAADYRLLQLTLAAARIPHAFSSVALTQPEIMTASPFWDERRHVGTMRVVDRARDGYHPGKGSHRRFAEEVEEKLERLLVESE